MEEGRMPGTVVSALGLVGLYASLLAPAFAADRPKEQWTLDPGFALEVDTAGYELPTALAFVPHAGSGPKDPLYFVVELRGKVKVVTNDRTVLVFADLTIVFLSLRHSFSYELVFRSSGYAVVTVLIRIALTAPPYLNVGLGVGATLLGIALAAAYPSTAEAPRPPEPVEARGAARAGRGGRTDRGDQEK